MNNYILVFLTLCTNVLAQLSLRKGMKDETITNFSSFIDLSFSPNIIFGLLCYVISFGLYLVVLSKFEVSFIYPIVMSLGFLLILTFSVTFLDESLSLGKIFGILLMISGIFVISRFE